MTTAELIRRIEELTPQQRIAVEVLVNSLRAQGPQPSRRRESAMGKFAHVPISSEEFHRRKQEEIDLEERWWKK